MKDHIDLELLDRIGQKLWGAGWPQQMAAALQIDERRVRRWARGLKAAPASLKPRLTGLLEARGDDVRRLLEELNQDA